MKRGSKGFTMVEICAGMVLLAMAAFSFVRFLDWQNADNARIKRLASRISVLDYYFSVVRNANAWRNTVESTCVPGSPNLPLKNHLRRSVTLPTVTSAGGGLVVCNTDGSTAIAAAGTGLNSNGEVVATGAIWSLTAQWRGLLQNSAEVELTLTPLTGPAGERSDGIKTVLLFKPSYQDRCVTKTAWIPVGPSFHAAAGPYIWNGVTLNCDAGYTRTGVGMAPGCGALGVRTTLSDTIETQGGCYQISATDATQKANTGCNAGQEIRGSCSLTCCSDD